MNKQIKFIVNNERIKNAYLQNIRNFGPMLIC